MAKLEEEETDDVNRSFLSAGKLLRGKYRIDGVIGTGGMAVVYAATHRNRKRFAIKVLHPQLSTRSEIRARFVREGYLANSVEHPGVVSVLDDDVTEDGAAFLVMELLEGATVEGFAPRTRPLPLRESLSIAIDVLDVLDAAHERSIVHRDIKPANLFVTRQGRVKVLDFGIARLRDATLGLKATGTGATLGTPAFMAPEQALAIASEIDARTDLWAVGATLFTMLSGSLVHPGDNARQVMVRAATEPARSLASLSPEVPLAVAEWVNKALQFDKSARWESAAAMRDAALRIQRDLFGPVEDGCAKRLFELCPRDIAMLPTEHALAGALRSAVRETARTTLESHAGNSGASRPMPAPRLDVTSERRLVRPVAAARLAGIAVAVIALGGGLSYTFTRLARRPVTSLSAAGPSTVTPASTARPTPDERPVGAQLPFDSAQVAPSLGSADHARPAATTISASGAASSAAARRSSLEAVRSAAPPHSARPRAQGSPVVVAPASALPVALGHAPSAPPQRNPLQLELQ